MDALAKLAVVLRVVQTTMVALFAHKHTEGGVVGVLRSTHPLLGLAALAVFAFGQALNAGIYHAIGKNGYDEIIYDLLPGQRGVRKSSAQRSRFSHPRENVGSA